MKTDLETSGENSSKKDRMTKSMEEEDRQRNSE